MLPPLDISRSRAKMATTSHFYAYQCLGINTAMISSIHMSYISLSLFSLILLSFISFVMKKSGAAGCHSMLIAELYTYPYQKCHSLITSPCLTYQKDARHREMSSQEALQPRRREMMTARRRELYLRIHNICRPAMPSIHAGPCF